MDRIIILPKPYVSRLAWQAPHKKLLVNLKVMYALVPLPKKKCQTFQ